VAIAAVDPGVVGPEVVPADTAAVVPVDTVAEAPEEVDGKVEVISTFSQPGYN